MAGTFCGTAKYLPGTSVELLERYVYQNGTKVENGATTLMEFDHVIGASVGQQVRWMLVERSSGTIHGRPITQDLFRKLLKRG